MVTEIRHAGIVVRSLVKAMNFYKKLGFIIWSVGNVSTDTAEVFYKIPIKISYCKLKPDLASEKVCLELYQIQDHGFAIKYWADNNRVRFNHVSLTVKDISETWKFFKQKHLLCSRNIMQVDKHMLFFAHDLDGNLLELVQPI